MQEISKLAESGLATFSPSTEDKPDYKPSEMVLDIFRRLGADYGQKFNRRFVAGSDHATQTNIYAAMMDWDQKLHRFPPELIQYGFKRLDKETRENKRNKKESWPPTASEFAELCRPCHIDLRIPSVNEAFKAAKNKNFKHSAIVNQAYLAISREDWGKPDSYVWPKFNAVYKRLMMKKASGEHIEWPKTKLLAAREKPDPKELEANFSKWRDIINKKCDTNHSN